MDARQREPAPENCGWQLELQLSAVTPQNPTRSSSGQARQQRRGRSPRCRLMLARCRLVRACQYTCVKTQRLSADGSLVTTADELAGICVHHVARLTVLAATLASWAEGQVVSALPTRGSGGQATGRRRRCGVALGTCWGCAARGRGRRWCCLFLDAEYAAGAAAAAEVADSWVPSARDGARPRRGEAAQMVRAVY